MRIDNNEEKDDKDDVGEIAEVLPNDENGGFFVGEERFNSEKVADEVIHSVDTSASKIDERADEPADAGDMV